MTNFLNPNPAALPLTLAYPSFAPAQQNNNPGNTFQWVQSQSAAEAYLVAPGQSVILMDSNAPVIYYKSADATGRYLPMKTYDLVERVAQSDPVSAPPVSTESFVRRDELVELVRSEVDRYLNTPVKKEG